MKFFKSLATAAIFGVAALSAQNAAAAFTTYSTFGEWLGGVGSAPVFTENFEDTNLIPQITNITLADPSGSLSRFGQLYDRVTTTASTVFSFAVPMVGAGAYWDLSPANYGLGLLLYADGVIVSATEIANTTGQFWGFTSDTPFDMLEIRGGTLPGSAETYQIPDLYVAAVPIPAALPLFLSALVGLGVIGRRKQLSSAAA